jgi:hypothetical protein
MTAFRTALLLGGLLGAVALPGLAFAQATGMGGAGASSTVTIRATVKHVGAKSHLLEVTDPSGQPVYISYDPAMAGAARLHKGDVITLKYHTAVSFVLAAPGTPLPPDTLTVKTKMTKPGEPDPMASAHARMVVTGLVVGVDTTANTISLAPLDGGRVHDLAVTDPAMQARLSRVKVGDTLTAIFTQGEAVAIERAP